jgi:LPS sulfotransferase NodH
MQQLVPHPPMKQKPNRPHTSAKYDLETCVPQKSLLLCSGPRSGSSWLAIGLYQSNCGCPMEYLNSKRIFEMGSRLGFKPAETIFAHPLLPEHRKPYIQLVLDRRTTKNGVFSCNLHLQQWIDFNAPVGGNFNTAVDVPSPSSLFPNPHLVFVQRRDCILQAVSLTIAQQTQAWSSEKTPQRKPYYSFEMLWKNLGLVLRTNTLWRQFRQSTDLPYIELVYEEFSKNYLKTLKEIHRFMGLEGQPWDHVDINPIERQRSTDNVVFAKRFLQELKAKGKLERIKEQFGF